MWPVKNLVHHSEEGRWREGGGKEGEGREGGREGGAAALQETFVEAVVLTIRGTLVVGKKALLVSFRGRRLAGRSGWWVGRQAGTPLNAKEGRASREHKPESLDSNQRPDPRLLS
ncbi:hypothetical protein E2C01_081892 [Portunus trituberculatus]|uniref:Uncharacterized protein n=1 Tax=Portunus trituberculatus TaxID=210409 RepID=A0A5B7J3I5_PORTR|nr:hypothetical protein [Portunus trituberculatus]